MTYIPQHFRVSDEPTLQEFMRTYDFATIVTGSADGLVASHVPVLVRPSGATLVIVGHMARANHHWRLLDGATPALVVFHGPHGYVSPTWYETAPAVPTWNYGVVHAHGLPTVNEDEAFLRGVLADLRLELSARQIAISFGYRLVFPAHPGKISSFPEKIKQSYL